MLAGKYLDVKRLYVEIPAGPMTVQSEILDVKTLDGYADVVQDEVDRLVEAWRRERPELDVTPMEVLSRVTRLARHLDRARRQAFAAQDLESWEFDVLSALRRSGEPYRLSPGRLLRETMVTSGTMTNRIDRMAARGLVARLPDPSDRRGVQVQLTASGRLAVDAALDQLLMRERDLLDGLPQAEQRRLSDMLRVLVIPFDDA
jgi:DNA-binding MarR family transcriptional regulator